MTAAIVILAGALLLATAAAATLGAQLLRDRTRRLDERTATVAHGHAQTLKLERVTAERDDAERQRRHLADRLAASDAEARELALPQLEGYRCVIHGRDGTIRGVVERVYPDAYLVSHPEYLDTAQPAHLLDGAALIPRSPEPLVQRLEPFDPAAGRESVPGPLIVPAIPAEV